jgi:hypothetical protein
MSTSKPKKHQKMKHGHNNWHLGEVKYGVCVPNNLCEAFTLNQENKNTYWADAIALEMNALKKIGCFKIPSSKWNPEIECFQFAPPPHSLPPLGLSLMSRVPSRKGLFYLW